MEWPVITAVLVAIISPIGAYILAARKMSGKVATSDAEQLWQESRSIRDDYRERLSAASDRIREVEARIAACEGQNTGLTRENIELTKQVAEQMDLIGELRRTIAHQVKELNE